MGGHPVGSGFHASNHQETSDSSLRTPSRGIMARLLLKRYMSFSTPAVLPRLTCRLELLFGRAHSADSLHRCRSDIEVLRSLTAEQWRRCRCALGMSESGTSLKSPCCNRGGVRLQPGAIRGRAHADRPVAHSVVTEGASPCVATRSPGLAAPKAGAAGTRQPPLAEKPSSSIAGG